MDPTMITHYRFLGTDPADTDASTTFCDECNPPAPTPSPKPEVPSPTSWDWDHRSRDSVDDGVMMNEVVAPFFLIAAILLILALIYSLAFLIIIRLGDFRDEEDGRIYMCGRRCYIPLCWFLSLYVLDDGGPRHFMTREERREALETLLSGMCHRIDEEEAKRLSELPRRDGIYDYGVAYGASETLASNLPEESDVENEVNAEMEVGGEANSAHTGPPEEPSAEALNQSNKDGIGERNENPVKSKETLSSTSEQGHDALPTPDQESKLAAKENHKPTNNEDDNQSDEPSCGSQSDEAPQSNEEAGEAADEEQGSSPQPDQESALVDEGTERSTNSNNDTNVHNESFDEPACSICLDDYEEGDICVTSRACSHRFHRDCVLDWLNRRSKTGCPYCRRDMVTNEEIWENVQRIRRDRRSGRRKRRKERIVGRCRRMRSTFACIPCGGGGTSRNGLPESRYVMSSSGSAFVAADSVGVQNGSDDVEERTISQLETPIQDVENASTDQVVHE